MASSETAPGDEGVDWTITASGTSQTAVAKRSEARETAVPPLRSAKVEAACVGVVGGARGVIREQSVSSAPESPPLLVLGSVHAYILP